MTLQEAIKLLVERSNARHELYCTLCTVNSVDNNERTCEVTPLNGNADLGSVRIQATLELAEGLYIEPKVNSTVLVAYINQTQAAVIQCSEIENIYIDTNGNTVFNGGHNGGLIKISDLVTKLNNLENKVNEIVTWSSAHTHTGVTPGPGSSGTAVGIVGSLTPTTVNELENDKVQH